MKAEALFERTTQAARIVHEGFWLGILTAQERVAVTARFYSASRTYLSREHNASAMFDWERLAIAKHFPAGSSVLVPAAGAGREVLQLRRMGYQAHGFDCSEELVRMSEQLFSSEGAGSPVVWAPPNEVPAGLPAFDGIIVGWGGYHHIPGRGRRIHFLQQLRNVVAPGAPLLVSFFGRSGQEASDRWLVWTARLFRLLTCFRGEPVEPGDRLTARTQCHCFTEAEIRDELKAAGFRLEHYSVDEYGHAIAVAE